MTVRQKMNHLIDQNPNLRDLGIFRVDNRRYGILQDINTKELTSVYESKDDIDDDGRPIVRSTSLDIGDFLNDNFENFD